MTNKKTSHKNNDASFDRVAWFYDALATLVFGSSIKNAQVSVLGDIEDNSRVLLIGGGTGWILPYFPDKNLTIYYLEASPEMIKKSRQRKLPQLTNKVIFQTGNESYLKGQEPFDVIFTPFFLDLFERKRFAEVVFLLDEKLKKGGKWLWVDFTLDKNRINKILLRIMYTFFRTVCGIEAENLPPVQPFLFSLGYKLIRSNSYYQKFISAKVFLK